MIPQNITRDHVVQALQEIDTTTIPSSRQSVDFDVVHAGKKYPPKYVISIAHKHAYGAELASDEFSPNDASTFLKKLGFDIVKRPKPGLVGPEADIESARVVFERLVPDVSARKIIAEMFADAIERANAAGEERWGITLHSGLIRLNGGRIFMFDVRGSACGLAVDPTFVAKETLERLEASGTRAEGYVPLPEVHIYMLPYADVVAPGPNIREGFLHFVEKAVLTARRCVWSRTHSPAILEYLSDLVGRDLPRPSYGEEALERSVYWVNQGRSFEAESAGGHLFAGKKDARGATPTHWERLTKLVPGDVVVHYAEGAIRAVSRVRAGAVDATREEDASVHGWRVDVEMWTLPTPVALDGLFANNAAALSELGEASQGPFDKNNSIKQGYLWEFSEDGLAVVREGSREKDAWPAWAKNIRSRSWMFHANPTFFDVRRAVKTLHEMTWTVRQHKSEIRVNDTVFLWEAGPKSAIVALARVLSEPAPAPANPAEEPFFVEKVTIDESEPVVRLAIERVLDTPIEGDDMRGDPLLATLPAFTSPQRTNSAVSAAQAEVLVAWVDGKRPPRVVKIAPGDRGDLWEECKKGGYICVGWDEVGDLKAYADWPAFRKAFGARCEIGKIKGHVTIKAQELWTLSACDPATRSSRTRASRTSSAWELRKEPGYVWDQNRKRFKHTVRVDWDTSMKGDVPAYKHWGVTTVDKVPPNIIGQILPDLAPPAARNEARSPQAKRHGSIAPPAETPFASLRRALQSKEKRLWFSDDLIAHYLLALQAKRFVILTGVSGTGKTKLALAVAEHFRPTARTTQYSPRPAGAVAKRVAPSMLEYRRMVLPSSIAMGLRLAGLQGTGSAPIDVEYPEGHIEVGCYRDVRSMSNSVHQIALKGGLADWVKSVGIDKEFYIERIDTAEDQRDRLRFTAPKATEVNATIDNFAIIPVRPDWTDGRGLLGFYNHLTRRYVMTPFLRLVLAANDECRRADAEHRPPAPFFAILDEMNLARVEQYFSDFLSALESDKPISLHHDARVASGELEGDDDEEVTPVPTDLLVPPNLFFTGTVNVDETTYMFSPKVLDRAFVIEFNDVDLANYGLPAQDEESSSLALANWQGFEAHRAITAADWDQFDTMRGGPALRDALRKMHGVLEADNRHFGYRVANEIARFLTLAAAQCAAPDDDDTLDLAVISKILPKLHGTQQELENTLVTLFKFTVGDENPSNPEAWRVDDRELVTKVEGEESAREPRLPRSSFKLWRMIKRVRAQGFTSFIE